MAKWYALALIVAGLGLVIPAPRPGEFGLPLYALIGWALLVIGVGLMAALIFIRL